MGAKSAFLTSTAQWLRVFLYHLHARALCLISPFGIGHLGLVEAPRPRPKGRTGPMARRRGGARQAGIGDIFDVLQSHISPGRSHTSAPSSPPMKAIEAQLGHRSPALQPLPSQHPNIRKGATRHGTPLLEVRLPHDELARRLAVCAHIRCVHHDRLCLDFEREARWWAYSASPALRDTFRRDAFPVGKPANPPRELLDSLEEL